MSKSKYCTNFMENNFRKQTIALSLSSHDINSQRDKLCYQFTFLLYFTPFVKQHFCFRKVHVHINLIKILQEILLKENLTTYYIIIILKERSTQEVAFGAQLTVQTLMILTLLTKSFASIFVNFMAYSKHLHCGQMTSRKTKDPYLFSCLYFLYVCSCIQLFPRTQLHPTHLIFGSTKSQPHQIK